MIEPLISMASSKFPVKLFLRDNSPRIIFSFIVSLFHAYESVNQHMLIASPSLPYQLFDDSNPSHSALQSLAYGDFCHVTRVLSINDLKLVFIMAENEEGKCLIYS